MKIDLLAKDRDLIVSVLKEKEGDLRRYIEACNRGGHFGTASDHGKRLARIQHLRADFEATKQRTTEAAKA